MSPRAWWKRRQVRRWRDAYNAAHPHAPAPRAAEPVDLGRLVVRPRTPVAADAPHSAATGPHSIEAEWRSWR